MSMPAFGVSLCAGEHLQAWLYARELLEDILIQPLLPLLDGPSTRDAVFWHTVEQYSRTDMHTGHPRLLDQPLEITIWVNQELADNYNFKTPQLKSKERSQRPKLMQTPVRNRKKLTS